MLSNVYLHYVLDLWFERRFRKQCRGEAYYFRFADDFLACFQHREDAERFLAELKERLGKFHLEVEATKTKLLKFGRFAPEDAAREGKKPETFTFLGFTHYCGQTRQGVFKVKRRTSKKKFRAKLKEMTAWLRETRCHQKAGALLRQAKAKLQGHLNYYAITDNGPMCNLQTPGHAAAVQMAEPTEPATQLQLGAFHSALNWVRGHRFFFTFNPFRRPVGSENC